MIRVLTDLGPCMDFVHSFEGDPVYSDPMISNESQMECNLLRSVQKPNDRVLGVFDGEELTGLFVFLILEAEAYAEMIVGLSRSEAAWNEIADWLREGFPGFQADFVFNPRNPLARQLLEREGADFEPEQLKMLFSGSCPETDTAGVELLSDDYLEQYLAMHGTDAYWTGEKVAAAPERFRVLLAVQEGTVQGYLDVTHCFDENEPYDLWVRPEARRRGWGRKLMTKALELNHPKDMMLLVDVDNEAAIRLYRGTGFLPAPGKGCQTAFWHIPKK